MVKTLKRIATALLVLACVGALALAGCSTAEDTTEGDDSVADGRDSFVVTFDLNYSGSENITVSVYSGDTVNAPSDPERDGDWVFSGWYAESACETKFDFSTEITGNVTIYAGWMSAEETEDMIKITYMWNYEGAGAYTSEWIEYNTRLSSLPSATREGYLLKGWYTEAECENKFTVGAGSSRVTENLTLYALWYKGYTFEAEYTNLYDEDDEPRRFFGFSNNLSGEQAVQKDDSASNGCYLAGMYLRGSYVYFEIESDGDVDDASLYFTFALEYGVGIPKSQIGSVSSVSFSDSDFTITVNESKVSYSSISFNVGDLDISVKPRTSFKECYINEISLTEGTNVILLEVTNETEGTGGTQHAVSPLIDCMTLYSNTALSWNPVTGNVK